jgi:hypothetical protein
VNGTRAGTFGATGCLVLVAMESSGVRLETLVVHAGHSPDPITLSGQVTT